MCNPDYIFRTAPEAFGRWSAPQKKNVFQTFLDGGQVKKTCFYTFFNCNYGFPHVFFTPPSPINSLHFLKNSRTFFFLLFSSSTMMCFHRWPFIERGLFGNPPGVIWSVNREGVSLGVRLVSGVSLTIMVFCSLEAHVPPSVSPSIVKLLVCPISRSHWYSLPLEIVLGS